MNKCVMLFIAVSIIISGYPQTKKELSLKEAVELGLQSSPEVQSAESRLHAAEGRFWSGVSLPPTEASLSYEYVPIKKGLGNFSEKTLEVRQSFEFPTTYYLRGSKYQSEKNVLGAQLRHVRVQTANKIKTGYYKVLAKQLHRQFAQEQVELAKSFAEKAEIRTNVGEGTNLEKLTASVQLQESRNTLSSVNNELTAAIAELNYALGKELVTSDVVLSDSLVFTKHQIDSLTAETLIDENIPDIRIAKLQYETSLVDKKLAWSSLLPGFNLAYFRQSRDGDNGFYGASFGVSLPVWFLFDQRGKIQEAEANSKGLAAELQTAKNEIYRTLHQALSEYKNSYNQLLLYTESLLPQSAEIFSTAYKSYAVGEITYLEFLQARQLLISSRTSYLNALLNYNLSALKIEEITGLDIINK
jgi:outer membrane protein, heavy metal efflux system